MSLRRCAGLLQRLDVLADGARLLLVVPHAGHDDRRAHGVVGEERLAEPALVVGDEAGGGGEDVALGAVVALQPDDLGAGKVLLEAQDVVDLGAAPAVDRLVVVADAADVGRAAGDQPQPEILGDVGVLVLVDQRVAEAALVVGEHVRVLQEQPQHLEQQVAEVGGVELLEALLVGARRAPRPCLRRRRRPPRAAPCRASGRGSSSRRSGPPAAAPASGPCPAPRSRSPA